METKDLCQGTKILRLGGRRQCIGWKRKDEVMRRNEAT